MNPLQRLRMLYILLPLAAEITAQQTSLNLPNLPTSTQTTNGPSTVRSTTTTVQTSSKNSPSSSVVITGSGSSVASTGSIPQITSTSITSDGALTGLPTLTGAFSIIPPSVPPTANAPYMQTSNLPEGTVFIAVGAILGFLAMSVLLWRGLIAWSLHRSVKRAALHQNMADTKALFRAPAPPGAPFYKYSDRESTISLSGLGHKAAKKSGRPVTSQSGTGTGNLFFSPTAGAAGAGLATPGNRGSSYLPAGYYATGASATGNGLGHVPIGGPAISLASFSQPHTYSHARSVGPSPPDSPRIQGEGERVHIAGSNTLNLQQGYGSERAPSAYLDDLFDGDSAPPVPSHQKHHSASSRRFP